MTNQSGLSIAELHKAFGSSPVLTGLELVVPGGSFTTVLGTSGSGKTTMLRILAGFERPDAGSVRLDGTVLDDGARHVPPERRQVGYVSQEGSLFPHLTVGANVGFGLPRRERRGPRVAQLLETVGLAELGQRYPHQLSGGQQQRVALARALALGSRIVLLDEPFASLDASLRASVRDEVQSILRASETTAVLVTHDQDEALSSSDTVAVMREGTIAQVGSPWEIYSNPVDAEMACFLGEANLIDGDADGDCVTTPFGTLALHGAARHGPVTVLVRPEQIQIAPDEILGVAGLAESSGFHGHDAVVKIVPDQHDLPSTLKARVRGSLAPASGSRVSIAVAGTVTAWPRPQPNEPIGLRRVKAGPLPAQVSR